MDLRRLRAFAAVAETKHLTRAATRLNLSQPAVSAHIKALEDELGVVLFDRTNQGMELTRAGRELLPHCEASLDAIATFCMKARSMRGEPAGELRVGTVADPELLQLGAFLAKSVDRYPLLSIAFQQTMSGTALLAVKEGALDASFYFGELLDPEIEGHELARIRYRVAAPVQWREAIHGASWEAIAALPWILTPEISTHHRMVRDLFAHHGVAPSKVVDVDSEQLITSLVESGIGLSLIREDVAREKEKAGVLAVWENTSLETTLWFVHLGSRRKDPLVSGLVAVIDEIWPPARDAP